MRERLEREAEEERNRLFGVMTRLTEIRNAIIERERAIKEREARQQRRLDEERLLKERLSPSKKSCPPRAGGSIRKRTNCGLIEAEEKALSDRYDVVGGEVMRLRNEMEGRKGVKRGKEEVFKQMKSYGEGRKREPLPFKQLINILKASKDNEQMTEKFFPKEMEYHVLTETDPGTLRPRPGNMASISSFSRRKACSACRKARRT